MIPQVKEIIKMVEKIRKKEEAGEYNSRDQLTRYLSSMDFNKLKIIHTFMLAGREISQSPAEFDKETVESIFNEFLNRYTHQDKKDATIGYITEKRQLDEYLSEGLKEFQSINN